jgi:hypothetical protein
MTTVQRMTQRWLAGPFRELWFRPAAAGWWTAYVLLLAGVAVVLLRRIAGHCDTSPPAGALIVTGLVAASWIALLRRYRPRQSSTISKLPDEDLALSALLSFTTLLLLVAVSLPQASPVGLIAIWSGLIASETHWWTRTRWRRSAGGRIDLSQNDSRPERAATRHAAWGDEANLEAIPPEVTQYLTRMRTPEGGEAMSGVLRVEFTAQQKTQVVHVSFCPPFAATPQFCVEPGDGPPASVEVSQLAPFGARLEVKLDCPAQQSSTVTLQFEAFEP